MYILEVLADAGNMFGFFRESMVAEGRFAIVANGEYANGGYGPSTVDGVAYKTREAAEAAKAAMGTDLAR